MSGEVVLIDLSSIAFPIWSMSQDDPDTTACATQTLARIRALSSGHDHVAVCCDSRTSIRKDIDPTYKAQREKVAEGYYHNLSIVRERLLEDGFPVWTAEGFEADDVIATATARAVGTGHTVLIVSSDKDLLQLVGPSVSAMSVRNGELLDAEGVMAKFGVRPDQMCDYLTLVGDAADNIKGANGIGPKRAVALLFRHESIDNLYAKAREKGAPGVTLTGNLRRGLAELGCKPAEIESLVEFEPRYEKVRDLITLRTDVSIPYEQVTVARVPKGAETFGREEMDKMIDGQMDMLVDETMQVLYEANATGGPAPQAQVAPAPAPTTREEAKAQGAMFLDDVIAATPQEWEKRLEPRNMEEARKLAKDMYDSKLFSAYGHPAAVLAVILAGREYGIPALASLRAFHLVDGKPTLAADFIRGLVLRSGKAKTFRCTERTATRATFETQRGDDPPVSLSFTIEEGRAAWRKDEAKWQASGWGTNPADMLVARASAKLARLVYPDVVHATYAPEELENG